MVEEKKNNKKKTPVVGEVPATTSRRTSKSVQESKYIEFFFFLKGDKRNKLYPLSVTHDFDLSSVYQPMTRVPLGGA